MESLGPNPTLWQAVKALIARVHSARQVLRKYPLVPVSIPELLDEGTHSLAHVVARPLARIGRRAAAFEHRLECLDFRAQALNFLLVARRASLVPGRLQLAQCLPVFA